MSEQISATSGAETPAGGAPATGAPPVVTSASPPKPATAEAAGTSGDPVAELAKLRERNAFLETEAKKAYGERDTAKKKFLESDEGKRLTALAAKATETELAQKKAEEEAAKARGEFQKLYEAKTAELEQIKAGQVESERKLSATRIREKLDSAYEAVGGVDIEAFRLLTEKDIADGKVAVGEDGQVKGHVEVVKKFIEAKPHLFKNGAKAALEKVSAQLAATGGGDAAAAMGTAFKERDAQKKGPGPASLAEAQKQGLDPTVAWQRLGLKPPT